MTQIKKIFLFVCIMLPLFFVTTNVKASSFFEDTKTEVAFYVNQGVLPPFHNDLVRDEGYQTIYTKYKTTNSLDSFGSFTEERLREVIMWYHRDSDLIWTDVKNNLDIEPKYLEANKILGLYWDSRIIENYSCLYLIWTSEYIPSEFMTIKEIVVNNKLYKQYDNQAQKDSLEGNWFDSDYYHYSEYNLTLHKTPISGFEKNGAFGVPLMQKYKISSFKAGIDEFQYFNDPDPTGKYNVVCNTEIEFDLGIVPKKDGVKLFQLVTHAYEIIKDCEVQSFFDLGFGGYIHNTFFNTTIDIDRIYRVDVSYTLSSENKSWYQIWLNTKEISVKKSLTAEKKANGLFNLFSYQGFKEGSFKSNVKAGKTFKYRLHLNYDEECWNLFDNPPYYEADYKLIKDFKILRMNYLVDDKVYDVSVKMDTVDGNTLSIINRDLIMDTDSKTWSIKEKTYETIDDFKEAITKSKDTLITIGAVIGGLIIVYILYKGYRFIKFTFKKEGENKK